MPDPESVELPDDRVVKPELGVVGQVVGRLPLGNDGVLQGGVLVGETASANRVAIDGLNLCDVSAEVVGEEFANCFLSPGIPSLVTSSIFFNCILQQGSQTQNYIRATLRRKMSPRAED